MEEGEETSVAPETESQPVDTTDPAVSKVTSEHETVNFDTTETETTADTNEDVIKLDNDLEETFKDDEEKEIAIPMDDDDGDVLNVVELEDEYEGEETEEYGHVDQQEVEEQEVRESVKEEAVEGEELAVEKKEPVVKESVTHKGSVDLTDITVQEYSDPDFSAQKITQQFNEDTVDNIFGGPRHQLGPVIDITPESSSYEDVEEEESEDISILAELGLQLKDKEPINREAYTEEYQRLREDVKVLKRRNGLFYKKIAEYYLRRKITKVFDDIDPEVFEPLLRRYEDKIKDFCDMRLRTHREREAVDNELLDTIILRDEQLELLRKNFQAMQDREFEIGHSLIDSKTGKVISEKCMQKLLQRQQQKSEDIAKIRLTYIKKRDKVREIEQKIKSLETIGGTLHLIDFEQLRMENQNVRDKVEEREEELMKLRNRYFRDMLGLAHIREKVNRFEVQIAEMKETKDQEDEIVTKKREELNNFKIKKDSIRVARLELKKNTGLLTYPGLLDDMERSMKTVEILQKQLDDLKENCEIVAKKMVNVKRHMSLTQQQQVKHYEGLGFSKYNRPTITYNVVPRIAQLKAKLRKMNTQNM